MSDKETHTYPDVFKMMKTYKCQDLKQEYGNLLLDNFSELYQSMKKYRSNKGGTF